MPIFKQYKKDVHKQIKIKYNIIQKRNNLLKKINRIYTEKNQSKQKQKLTFANLK